MPLLMLAMITLQTKQKFSAMRDFERIVGSFNVDRSRSASVGSRGKEAANEASGFCLTPPPPAAVNTPTPSARR